MKYLAIAIAVLVAIPCVTAQRRVTPVEQRNITPKPANAKKEFDRSRLLETMDVNGNVVLVDTVTGLEFHDSTATSIPKMIYPLIYRLNVGVNVWDLAMRALKQSYGLGGVWAELNMHNRYFVRFEGGVGCADITPLEGNFTFHAPLSPYFKIGAAYNMFYNSDPGYRFLAGINYGITHYKYDVRNAVLSDPYWGESSRIAFPGCSTTAGFIEITAGVRVKIVGDFAIGWDVIYHSLLHESSAPYGKPMYIPGYGKRQGSFTASLSLMWTFGLNKTARPAVE